MPLAVGRPDEYFDLHPVVIFLLSVLYSTFTHTEVQFIDNEHLIFLLTE